MGEERTFAWWKVCYFGLMFVLLIGVLCAALLLVAMMLGWNPILG